MAFPEVGARPGQVRDVHLVGGGNMLGETHFALHTQGFQLAGQVPSARIVPKRRADHPGLHIPLPQQAGDDGGVVEDEFADFFDERAGVMLG